MHQVLIIDKNPSLAEALAAQLSLPNSVHCQGAPAFNQVDQILSLQPDLAILDPSELHQDLESFCEELQSKSARTRLLCYSFSVSKRALQDAMAAGFHGCMSKYSSLPQLEVAIAAVLDGGVYFDPRFAKVLWPSQDAIPNDPLSNREREVLIRTAKGLANKQIAQDLDISAKTVETYKARAVQKLGLSDRSKVFAYAMDQGWIG